MLKNYIFRYKLYCILLLAGNVKYTDKMLSISLSSVYQTLYKITVYYALILSCSSDNLISYSILSYYTHQMASILKFWKKMDKRWKSAFLAIGLDDKQMINVKHIPLTYTKVNFVNKLHKDYIQQNLLGGRVVYISDHRMSLFDSFTGPA